SPRARRLSRSRNSSARSPRSVQQTQPELSSTVRSSTRRSRWWSMPTSPSSFTITAVSPMSGWARSREISVVFPDPRKPVTSVTGVLGKGGQQPRVERVERPAGELLRFGPEHSDVRDDGRPPLAVAQGVNASGPVRKGQAVVGKHAVEQHDAEPARP